MARRDAAQSRVARLTRELKRTRWRGIANLEVHNSKQERRDTPLTDQLAHEYSEARGVEYGGDRVAEIRLLLQDGLAAYWRKGHKRAAMRFRRLYFEPADSVPPKTPREVLHDVKEKMELAGQDYTAWQRIAFPHLAAFLITFVAAASEASAPRRTDVVPVRPAPEAPPRPPLGCGRVALAAVVALMVTCVVVARLLVGAAGPPHQTTGAPAQAAIVAGSIECWPDTTKPVVGVWIVASNGGSGCGVDPVWWTPVRLG